MNRANDFNEDLWSLETNNNLNDFKHPFHINLQKGFLKKMSYCG